MPEVNETAIIFDRDGVILDFTGMFYQFTTELYQIYQVTAPDREIILSYDFWLEVTVNELQIGPVLVKDRLNDIPRKYMKFSGIYPGIRQELKKLRDAGAKMAVISSWVGTVETREFISRHQLDGNFDCVLTADDLAQEVQGAPSIGREEIKTLLVSMALEQMDPTVKRVLVVGDTPEDIRAGKRIEAETVAVLTGNGTRLLREIAELQPDLIIESAARLRHAL